MVAQGFGSGHRRRGTESIVAVSFSVRFSGIPKEQGEDQESKRFHARNLAAGLSG